MRYTTAPAFRRALEDRLKALAGNDAAGLARYRKRVVFDRLLARLVVAAPGGWVLKGGFALDLRLADRARSTKDVDLAWHAAERALLDALLDAAGRDLGDYFAFDLERADIAPDLLGGAHRFRVTGSLAGRPFESFVLDVGTLDGPPAGSDLLLTPDLLGFAGISSVAVPTLPLAPQVAEKLHAYTRTYDGGRGSTRTKDLVDLALIAQFFPVDAAALSGAIDDVFARRATHESPAALPVPPVGWRVPYQRLALAVGLEPDLRAGHATAAAMLDPVLRREVVTGSWDPDSMTWAVR
ncbi:MAG: nucleotidyl transferase AbiEii/AbiGii toxin family protein [Actinobacteria bacterium]|nr:nucleotidyl transferase AbiEii/AbiGii toxin family protein [Actinomycetota bacterium]MCG2801760.1 nucleotidyl transferase AbiEii/AbiGii toxin family protein [Cellulomonas sp.]